MGWHRPALCLQRCRVNAKDLLWFSGDCSQMKGLLFYLTSNITHCIISDKTAPHWTLYQTDHLLSVEFYWFVRSEKAPAFTPKLTITARKRLLSITPWVCSVHCRKSLHSLTHEMYFPGHEPLFSTCGMIQWSVGCVVWYPFGILFCLVKIKRRVAQRSGGVYCSSR